jgi:hypothetical protein
MLMRATTEEQMGFAATMGIRLDQLGRGGRNLLIEDRDRSADRILEALNRSTMSSVRPIRPGPCFAFPTAIWIL